MVPLFLVLAAPLAKTLGVRLALWYTHWHASRTLRLATRLADVVLSVDERSFPLTSPKVRGIGHAIDVQRFAPSAARERGRAAAAARARPDRPLEGLRDDARGARAGRRARARRRARAPRPAADRRRAGAPAGARGDDRGLGRAADARAHRASRAAGRAARLLAATDALLSATQPRASETLDKVVYEAAACGVPVLASNPALDEFLGGLPLELRFPAARRAGARRPAARARGRRTGAARRRGSRAAPPSRRGPLARLVGGRGRRGPGRPEAGVAFGRGDRAIRAARARLRRARHPRAASVRPHTPPNARVRAPCPRDRRARDPRRARARAGPLRGARHPQHRLRRHDLLEPALA